ncbi:MAG: DUF1376 domain-containing protein [Gammaproteobacteria bacterium]|nr:DUF1376 domain-containing protein [Gammaproteobacteria bacterium]
MASELFALSTGDEFKAAVALWCRAWVQTPPGSLPDDDRVLAAFSGARESWPAVRDMALRGFVKCSDGRLYHTTLCEDVLRAAESRDQHAARVQNKNERQARWRERLKVVSAALREKGIKPPRGASLETLEGLLEASTHDIGVGVYRDAHVDGGEIGCKGNRKGNISNTQREIRSPRARDSADALFPLSLDFEIPKDWLTWARGQRADLHHEEIYAAAEKFRSHHAARSHARTRAGWESEWRKWVVNERAVPKNGSGGNQGRSFHYNGETIVVRMNVRGEFDNEHVAIARKIGVTSMGLPREQLEQKLLGKLRQLANAEA